MSIDPGAWYDPVLDASALYQGDIIYEVPMVLMPPSGKEWLLLRPNKPGTIQQVKKGRFLPTAFAPRAESQASDPWSDGTELVLAKATKLPVAILTQTCDLDQRTFFQCAPIYLIPGAKTPEEVNESYHQFPLPGDAELAASYIELSQVCSVHASYARRARLVKRLSGYARTALQAKLAKFYGRPFGFTTKDGVPQQSEYLCLRCLHISGAAVRRSFSPGSNFSACPSCGEEALWTKFPSHASARAQEPPIAPQRAVQPPETDSSVDDEGAEEGTA